MYVGNRRWLLPLTRRGRFLSPNGNLPVFDYSFGTLSLVRFRRIVESSLQSFPAYLWGVPYSRPVDHPVACIKSVWNLVRPMHKGETSYRSLKSFEYHLLALLASRIVVVQCMDRATLQPWSPHLFECSGPWYTKYDPRFVHFLAMHQPMDRHCVPLTFAQIDR